MYTILNMFFASALLSIALASVSQAQTPEGFTPVVNTKLEVMFNSTAVTEPGQQLSKAGEEVKSVLKKQGLRKL